MVCTSSAGKLIYSHSSMAKRGGKFCVAGGPGQISCTNNSYTPGISMHVFPKNDKVRATWTKFVWTHRPEFQPTGSSTLCSVHFHESCFTRLRLSAVQADTSESEDSGSTKPREKRILERGSVPTIHAANKAPEEGEPSDRDRRRSKAVSDIQSLCFCSNGLTSLQIPMHSISLIVKERKI